MPLPRTLARFAAAAAALVLLVACGDTGSAPEREIPDATIRIVHAVSDAPPISVQVDNNTPAVNGLAFGSNTGLYRQVTPGTRRIRIFAEGSTNPVADIQATLQVGQPYTILATGRVADASLGTLVVADTNFSALNGDVRLRVINASATQGPVNVAFVREPVVDTAVAMVENVAFRTTANYRNLLPGTYRVVVRRADTNAIIAEFVTPPLLPRLVGTVVVLDPSPDQLVPAILMIDVL